MAINWTRDDQGAVATDTAAVFKTRATLLGHVRVVTNLIPGRASVPVRRRLKLTGPLVRFQTPEQAAAREQLVFDSVQSNIVQVLLRDRMYKNVELEDAEVTFGGDGVEGGDELKEEVAYEQGVSLALGANQLIIEALKETPATPLGSVASGYDVERFGALILKQSTEMNTNGVDLGGLRLILGSEFIARIGTSKAFNQNPTLSSGVMATGVIATYYNIPVLSAISGIGANEAYLYHVEAVAFVSRPVASADSMEGAVVNVDGGLSFRSYRSADPRLGTALFVADCYPGAQLLEPEASVRWVAEFADVTA